MNVTDLAAWQKLAEHYDAMQQKHLRELFADDPERGARLSLSLDNIYADYSKNLITDETLFLLLELARARDIESARDAMFSGQKINNTENRAVLHTALRAPKNTQIMVDGQDVVPQVHEVLDHMATFANAVRSGSWTGYTGKPIKTVINIG
ncbi:glucose-6-phosphate isomerase, partial [Candidatus Saccharibacteria bacterium]